MAEGENTEKARLIAWNTELRTVHERLRQALNVTRAALETGTEAPDPTRELLLFCHGFCTALTGHHVGEDRHLFPLLAAEHPELDQTLRKLQQDHDMIGTLVAQLQAVVDRTGPPALIASHLEGLAAIMESHFRYEERQLLTILETLQLDADPKVVFGPL